MREPARDRALRGASHQHDVLSVPQAVAVGLSRQAVGRLVRSGHWRRLHRGVCWTRPEGDLPVLTALYAARLLAGGLIEPAGVIAYGSAARLWRLDTSRGSWLPEVVLPVSKRRPQPGGVRYRWNALSPADIGHRSGMPVTTVTATLRDLGRTQSYSDMLVLADAALRNGLITSTEIRAVAHVLPAGRRHPILAAAGRAESPFESRVRAEILAAGLPPPVLQHVVSDGGAFVARVDLAWPGSRLVVEADGAATHASSEALGSDLRRQNALVAAGWTVLRFTWADLGCIAVRVRVALERAEASRRALRP